MVLVDLFAILLIALILSSVLTWGFGWRHPARREPVGASLLFIFLILALSMWAAGGWIAPFGPVWYGTAFVDFLLIGLFVCLLVLALAEPKRPPVTGREAVEEVRESETVAVVFGMFFWVLVIVLLVAAIASYFKGA